MWGWRWKLLPACLSSPHRVCGCWEVVQGAGGRGRVRERVPVPGCPCVGFTDSSAGALAALFLEWLVLLSLSYCFCCLCTTTTHTHTEQGPGGEARPPMLLWAFRKHQPLDLELLFPGTSSGSELLTENSGKRDCFPVIDP